MEKKVPLVIWIWLSIITFVVVVLSYLVFKPVLVGGKFDVLKPELSQGVRPVAPSDTMQTVFSITSILTYDLSANNSPMGNSKVEVYRIDRTTSQPLLNAAVFSGLSDGNGQIMLNPPLRNMGKFFYIRQYNAEQELVWQGNDTAVTLSTGITLQVPPQ